MKRALFVLSVFAILASSFAQSSSEGKVIFKNRNIATPQPNPELPGYVAGGNANGTFNVGIYTHSEDFPGGIDGAGTLPGGVTVGLYYQERLQATTVLGTTTASAPFFVTPASQEVVIRDASGTALPPGSTPMLTIRAWTTASGSFSSARTSPNGRWGEWTFTSSPLGGLPPNGGAEIPVPTLTGWGAINNYSNQGVELVGPDSAFPYPWINSPTNGSVFAAPATVSLTGGVTLPNYQGGFVLTNLALLANGAVVSSQSGSVPLIRANTPPLAAGSYVFKLVAAGYWQADGYPLSYTSKPVNITVVAPVEITMAPAEIVSGEFQLKYTANAGLKYVIKGSADLLEWQPVATNTPNGDFALFAEPFAPAATRYYKVERLPNP